MKWKKNECLQQKTESAGIALKGAGQVEILLSMIAVFVVTLVMVVSLKISGFMIAGAYVEDALAASNLASALIDIEEYGKTREIGIADPENAFLVYKEALSVNLWLDENGRSFQQELLKGSVRVIEYMVFNVTGDMVERIKFSETGNMEREVVGKVGEIYTPDGVLVETTTIYSKVAFCVHGLVGQDIYVEKEKSVDVKRDESE